MIPSNALARRRPSRQRVFEGDEPVLKPIPPFPNPFLGEVEDMNAADEFQRKEKVRKRSAEGGYHSKSTAATNKTNNSSGSSGSNSTSRPVIDGHTATRSTRKKRGRSKGVISISSSEEDDGFELIEVRLSDRAEAASGAGRSGAGANGLTAQEDKDNKVDGSKDNHEDRVQMGFQREVRDEWAGTGRHPDVRNDAGRAGVIIPGEREEGEAGTFKTMKLVEEVKNENTSKRAAVDSKRNDQRNAQDNKGDGVASEGKDVLEVADEAMEVDDDEGDFWNHIPQELWDGARPSDRKAMSPQAQAQLQPGRLLTMADIPDIIPLVTSLIPDVCPDHLRGVIEGQIFQDPARQISAEDACGEVVAHLFDTNLARYPKLNKEKKRKAEDEAGPSVSKHTKRVRTDDDTEDNETEYLASGRVNYRSEKIRLDERKGWAYNKGATKDLLNLFPLMTQKQ